MSASRVVERAHLAHLLENIRTDRRIVFTNGCFDILHVGHVRLLQHARSLGDVLIVGVNDDGSVERLKGPSRPLVTASDRAEILAALECVDWVTLFSEDTPIETLRALRPHVHVKGGDYRPEDLPEAAVLREMGVQLEIVPLVPGRSTTALVSKMQQ